MARIRVTTNDLLEAVRTAGAGGAPPSREDGWLPTAAFVAELGLCRGAVIARLRRLEKQGRAEGMKARGGSYGTGATWYWRLKK